MDSAFVHARALFEFFVQSTTDNYYGSDEFLGAVLKSDSYTNDWKGSLHSFFMHAQDRSRPSPLKSSGAEKHLSQMPIDFAREILKLWEEFEEKLGERGDQELHKLAREKRKEAIEKAHCVVTSTAAQQHAEREANY